MLKKNMQIDIDIDAISGDGSGIGKYEGQVIFVPFTAVGDKVNITVIKVTKSYAIGKINTVISASESRRTPDCNVFGKCGGCVFRHLNSKEEERIKTETVISAMRRIGHIDVPVEHCVTPSLLAYRNKAQLPVSEDENGLHCGFYASHSHRIIDGSINCVTTPKAFAELSKSILSFMKDNKISGYNEATGKGVLRHLYYRINKYNRIMVCLVTNTKLLHSTDTENKLCAYITKEFPEIISIMINYNPESTNVILGSDFRLIWGEEYFEDELLGTKLKMSPDSFFQVNREGAEKVYSIGFSLLDGQYENVYDLYCGIGSIGITLFNEIKNGKVKASAKRLFGIEIVEKAAECARENARLNGIENAEFIAADSGEITKLDWFDKSPPSLVILDPPRKGTTPELLDFLAERNVNEILYISCDPATLARDMGYLYNKGYTSSPVYPVNLFTGTKHVESVVLLSREKKGEADL